MCNSVKRTIQWQITSRKTYGEIYDNSNGKQPF